LWQNLEIWILTTSDKQFYHLVIKLTDGKIDGKIYAKDNDTCALLGSA
jgi:hypothetical protein